MKVHAAALTPEMFKQIDALWEQLPEPRPQRQNWVAYCSQVPWSRVLANPALAAQCAEIMAQMPG